MCWCFIHYYIICCFEYDIGFVEGAGRQTFSTAQLFHLLYVNKAFKFYNFQTVNCGRIQNVVAV